MLLYCCYTFYMKKGTPKPPPYRVLLQRNLNNPDFSFYEIASDHQRSLQSEALDKTGHCEELPFELAKATHAHAARFFEETSAAFQTDCKSGCAYCCYQPATVFPFEAIQIARALKARLSRDQLSLLVDRMKTRVAGLKSASVLKNINNKTACPLLADEKCSVYEDRPLTCRLAHSFSVKRCRTAFQNDRFKVQIPVSLELQSGIGGMIEGAFEGLPKNKLDANLYELCSAVLAALVTPNAAERWAKGDCDVFKNCIKDDT